MGDETFNEKSLTEKLSKLNSSQQSIESLSRWCITHRKKAKQIVETWESIFKSVKPEQRVSLLYLSNDILQNSRRKGSEFVNEFWKVLPGSLKDVYDSGHANCRKVASRLVDIWEERKVFGSRGQNLKNEVLGKNPSPVSNPTPASVNNSKNSNPIKVVKRDANSLRIKLAVGGLPEKIITALQLVHDETAKEEAALDKCHDAVSCVREIEKDVVNVSSQGNLNGSDVVDQIKKQENVIQESISQLENSEATRVALVSALTEALQAQVARDQIEQAAKMRNWLTSPPIAPPTVNQPMAEPPTFPPAPPTDNPTMPTHSVTSFLNSNTEEDNTKATAAAVAAKLAASTSSAQMLTSILSSLVAEEAASMSTGLKRPRLESNPEGANSSAYFPSTMTNMPPVTQLQAPFLPPPAPPPPLAPPPQPYSYGGNNLMQPPMSSNAAMGFARSGPPHQQQQPASGGYYRPMGNGFYGQSHPPPTPPIHRQ
ncbi:hypothetical protein BUALT_Bualt16G0106000 [Buddleja alternifolia]|uniref:CID domain-containing protein n=1 Tax=Buddleja alternifolia TaxID=168488 RepID=A0AAV6WJU9_9LAMI|nr:hypothetical protein BUALT_Bualt16G0106000 [Buddleja alternifolia]